jgi:hypothetical protein
MWDPDPGTGDRRLTALGQIAAAHGVAPADFAWLWEKGDGALFRLDSPLPPAATPPREKGFPPLLAGGMSESAALLIAATTPYVRALPYVPLVGSDGRSDALSALSAEVGEQDRAARALVRAWLESGALTAATLRKAARRVLALRLWLGPDATEDVEEKARASAGSLAALAEACAWLVGCLADVGDQLGSPSDATAGLRSVARRLPLGAPDEGLDLADLRCPGLGRDALRALLQNGIASPADIAAADAAELARLLPRSAIAHLGLHLREHCTDSTPAPTMAFRSADPDHIVVDGAAVRVRPAEMKLARLLAHHAGDCVPYDRICEQMWGEGGEVYQKQVFVHKSRLLRQLARALPRAIADALIVAVPGIGLRMDLPRERISFA